MDFGDILEEWEKLPPSKYAAKEQNDVKEEKKHNNKTPHPVDVWLRRYGVSDKDAEEARSIPIRISPKKLPADAHIDLHGLSREEAWSRLEQFVENCYRRNLKKILIIHGKGNHSGSSPVLTSVVHSFIEQDYRLGASGSAEKSEGGSGATWVILKTVNQKK